LYNRHTDSPSLEPKSQQRGWSDWENENGQPKVPYADLAAKPHGPRLFGVFD